jgi:hypothetical protein
MDRFRPFTGVLPNEFAGAATPAPGRHFHAVIPHLREPFSAFFLSTAAEQSLTLRGRGENFHLPLRPVLARPNHNSHPTTKPHLSHTYTPYRAYRSYRALFLLTASNANKGRENTKFDHLDKTKDLATQPPALGTDSGPLGRIGRLRRTLSPACPRLPRRAVGPAVGPAVSRLTRVRIHPGAPESNKEQPVHASTSVCNSPHPPTHPNPATQRPGAEPLSIHKPSPSHLQPTAPLETSRNCFQYLCR